jgi:hypothetical protein
MIASKVKNYRVSKDAAALRFNDEDRERQKKRARKNSVNEEISISKMLVSSSRRFAKLLTANKTGKINREK